MTIESLIKEAYFINPAPKQMKAEEMQKIAKALDKISSLPYKPEAHEAVCGVMKIASQALENMVSALELEQKKSSNLEKLSGIRGIVDDMLEHGLISKQDVQIKTSALMKKTDRELEIVKEAICLAGSNLNGNSLFTDSDQTSGTSNKSIFAGVLD